jgi:hypothetical protein
VDWRVFNWLSIASRVVILLLIVGLGEEQSVFEAFNFIGDWLTAVRCMARGGKVEASKTDSPLTNKKYAYRDNEYAHYD